MIKLIKASVNKVHCIYLSLTLKFDKGLLEIKNSITDQLLFRFYCYYNLVAGISCSKLKKKSVLALA